MKEVSQVRKEILKLEKLMQNDISSHIATQLAEKYVEIGEPVQAVAVLLESIEAFPEDVNLLLTCSQYIIAYQDQNSAQAQSLLNAILAIDPDNQHAHRLLENMSANADSDRASQQDSDLADMPTLRTRKVTPEAIKERRHFDKDKADSNVVANEEILSKAFCCLNESDLQGALELFQETLEKDPDNSEAQDGFRRTYKAILNERERIKFEKKGEIIGRTIRFFEAIKSVVGSKDRSKQI